MKTTKYLYDIEPDELKDMLYFDALQYKYDACTKVYRSLVFKENKTEEETIRLHCVLKAQEHTKALLNEREEH